MTDNHTTQQAKPSESPAPNARLNVALAWVRRHWPLVAMLAAMALIAVIIRPDAALGLFRLEPPLQTTYTDQLTDLSQLRRDAAIQGEIELQNGVVGIKPGGRYRITYSFEREPGERVFLMLRHFWRPYLQTTVTFTPEGGPPAGAQNVNWLGSPPLDVTPYLGEARRFRIELSAQAAPDAPGDLVPVFDSIILRRTSDVTLPDLPAQIFALVIALAAFHFTGRPSLRARWPHAALRPVAAVALFAALLLATRLTSGALPMVWIAAAALLGLWLGEGAAPLKKLKPSPSVEIITLLFIAGLALMLRWAALPPESGKQLEPDARGYITIAHKMAGPFQTDFREPALIWWVWLAQKIIVDHEVALRVMSCLLAVVTVMLTFIIGRRVMPGPLALLAVLIVAVSPGFIAENLRGLRLEGYIVALQSLTLVLLWMPRRPGPLWIAGAGAAAGFAVLSNLAALSFCAVFLVYFGWRRRWRWFWWPLPFAVMLAMPAPYLVYSHQKWGDAFHSSNVHAVFYRNQEFKGQPGYPTVEEVNRDSYAGEKLTTAEYFFKHHSLGEVVGRSLKGFMRLYAVSPENAPGVNDGGRVWVSRVRDFVFDGRSWLLALYLAGLVVAALRREADLLVIYIGINLTSFFLAATPRIIFDPRLFLHYVPFACLFPPLALMAWPAFKDWRDWWRERRAGKESSARPRDKASGDNSSAPASGKRRRPRRSNAAS